MVIIGTAAVGVVWGWLLVRLARGRPWQALVRALLGAGAQAAAVVPFASALGLLWYAGGLTLGVMLAAIWVLSLEARLGPGRA